MVFGILKHKQSNLRSVGDHYNWENQDDILSRIEKAATSTRRLGTPAPEGHPILGVSLVNSKQLQKAYAKSTQKNSTGKKETTQQ